MCGLEIRVTDGTVDRIRGDREDVWSKGYLCPKGSALGHLHHDPDRIRVPMIRTGDTWAEVEWETAFARCDELLAGVISGHGKEAVSCYIGNPTAHNFSLGRYVGLFIGLAALPVVYSAGTVDQWPKNLTAALMYGAMWSIPTPDVPRTDYWIVMGGNPHASQGSLLACVDILGELDGVRERGQGRRDRPAPHGNRRARRRVDPDRARHRRRVPPGDGQRPVRRRARGPRPHRGPRRRARRGACRGRTAHARARRGHVPDPCRHHPPDHPRVRSRSGAALYGRIGTCNQEFGTLASWLVDVLNILTANFDTPGGIMFGKPIAWGVNSLPNPDLADGVQIGRWTSRVRGIPEVLGQVPVSCLAEEIDTPGPGQIRALVTIAGNPVISAPGAARLDTALDELDCMISIDNALERDHAPRARPAARPVRARAAPLRRPDPDVAGAQRGATLGTRVRPGRPSTRMGDPHVVGAMCAGIRDTDIDVDGLDDGFFAALAEAQGVDPSVAAAGSPGRGPLRLLDLQIRTGPWGDRYGDVPDGLTLQSFRDAPHGIDMGPMVPRIREILATPNGRIDLAPEIVLADLARLSARVDRPADGLLLTSRRHLRSNNSWMHNVQVLVKGKDRCTLLIHPDDARAAGVADGHLARVTSVAGTVEVPVEVSDEMMTGVVSLPHGWGHDQPGTRQAVAREHAGVNNNLLAPVEDFDPISNNAAVNGIPVEVRPVTP